MTQNIDRRSFLAATPAAVTAAATSDFASGKPEPSWDEDEAEAGRENNPLAERVAVLLYGLRDAAGEWLDSIDEDGGGEFIDERHHIETAQALRFLGDMNGSLVESDLRRYVDFEAKGRQLAALATQLLKDRRPA